MLTLYTAPGTAGLHVHWLLLELGLPHELKFVDLRAGEHKQPAYLALNPDGVVPTLVLEDGTPIVESAAIAMHLADLAPAAGFAPAPGTRERAQYLQWYVYLANALQPPFRSWFYPTEAAGADAADAAKDAARQRIEAIYARLDAHLAAHGPHLLGESLSAVDFFLVMLMRWSRNMPKPATEWPHLAALAARLKARPSFATLYAREGLTEWA
ncbi:MAG: glutathione S-transferase family protein [Xanthomonadales bacterium]|jgi:glutathione S-transferase|nr:glutathione S-transferase family protein [Xanthomonadales bacterium]